MFRRCRSVAAQERELEQAQLRLLNDNDLSRAAVATWLECSSALMAELERVNVELENDDRLRLPRPRGSESRVSDHS